MTSARVQGALVGRRAPQMLKDHLKSLGWSLIELPENQWAYAPVEDHPDLYMTRVGFQDRWVIDYRLRAGGDQVVFDAKDFVSSDAPVGPTYPQTASLSVIYYKHYALGSFKTMDPVLVSALKEAGYDLVSVRQGYVKCTTRALTNDLYLSSDPGVTKVLRGLGAEVFEVVSTTIQLPGHAHGFIGGATFMLEGILYFIGDLSTLPHAEALEAFLNHHNMPYTCLGQGPLIDCGSVEFF